MKTLLKLYDGVIVGLAALSGAILLAIFGLVVYDVTVRSLGFQPPSGTVALSEYGLLYFTMFAAPWLLRAKSHVFVESVRKMFPPSIQRAMERTTYVICIAVTLILTYLAVDLFFTFLGSGETDERTFSVARWVAFVPVAIGCLALAGEFLRLLLGADSLYDLPAADRDTV